MSSWALNRKGGLQYCRHFLSDNGVFHVERCMCVMQSGTQMVKLKSGSKGLVRLFYLDENRTCIRWRPSRKNEKAKITIDSICKVLEWSQSASFHRRAEGSFDPSCCFSIYHGSHMEILDLVTSNSEDARTWITGLKYLMSGIKDEDLLAKRLKTHNQWMKQMFEEADMNGDGLLHIEEIYQLMHKLNVNLPRRKIRQIFQEADTGENKGKLNLEEFSVFYKMMSLRRDLFLLVKAYSNKKDHLTVEEFAHFLKSEQKMYNVTIEYCIDIIRKFEVSEAKKQQNLLGVEGFTNFMRSPACDIFNPLHSEVNQDMDQPLCNYFIASSHNTYLTGDQLLSQSKMDMYSWVLQAGCRSVEVDCWDGPDGEPIVQHGYTLTSKVLFQDVVETINKYAFIKNEYPVILSIENHCSIQQQKKIVQYLKDILGSKLELFSIESHGKYQLPSPQSLKGKILIKGKKLPADLGTEAEEGEVSDEDSADEIEEECKLKQFNGSAANHHQVECLIRKKLDLLLNESQLQDKENPDQPTVCALLRATHKGLNDNLQQKSHAKENMKESGKKFHSSSFISTFSKQKKSTKSKAKLYNPNEEDQQNFPGKEAGPAYRLDHRKKTTKLYRGLSDLVIYTNSVTSQDLLGKGSAGKVLSLNETQAHELLHQKPEQFICFNQKHFTCVYPSAFRIDSSNCNPQEYWNVGCQMVALNYQTDGRMMQLNRALFMQNGNCGYVLKPQSMCQGVFNPFSEDPLHGHPKKQLTLKIISGQQLPKPPNSMLGDRCEIIDPFVEVEIIGLPIDCCKEQTRVVDDNGFNPVWEETITFTVHMPEIALVRFLVWNHDPIGRDFVGEKTVSFSTLMPGYRHIYLEGMPESSLFVHVTIHDICGKQLMGLKGLFSKNPKYPSVNKNQGNLMQKKSFGNRILRRTASAPTKEAKKSKSMLLETCADLSEQEANPLNSGRDETCSTRRTKKTHVRPISMPVDNWLYGEISPPAGEKSEAKTGKNSSVKSFEDKIMTSSLPLAQCCPLSSANELNESQSQQLARSSSKELAENTEHCASNNPMHQHVSSENVPSNAQYCNNSVQMDDMCDQRQLHQHEQFQCNGILWQQTSENLLPDQKLTNLQEEPNKNISTPLPNAKFVGVEEKIEHYIATASPVPVNEFDPLQSLGTTLDSTVSHLIDAMSLPSENEIGSPISALIAQFDTTDRTNLTMISSFHETSKHSTSMLSGLSQSCGVETNAPVNLLYRDVKAKKACLNLTADTTIFSSPEMSDHSSYTIINEEILSPISFNHTPKRNLNNETLEGTFNKTLNVLCTNPNTPVNSGIDNIQDTPWSEIDADSKCSSTSTICITADNAILNASPPIDSFGSSLLEVDDFDFTVTTIGSCNIESGPRNSSSAGNFYQMTQNRGKNATSFLFLGNSPVTNANERALCISERNIWNPLHSDANETTVAKHPFNTAKQPNASKSKSLGDLTSEDISCTFESKYKFISKSFIVPSIKGQKTMPSLKNIPKPTDALTEQLRKLVSLEQEENQEACVPLISLESDYQRGLVRKLSSRSQSRVRYVANRAKQIQEANKHKFSSNCTSGGVVLRKKTPVQHHTVNRHSTGSYIAGYLNQLEEEALEGRGIPEGSCGTLLHRYGDNFYNDDSNLQTEPNTVSEPEIYFLLRL
ncbi:1-phosphatidylinositol 4,5-bisphosphate phosphodiesterase eta-1 isoform X2 [Mobula birostris]|uniref:1-phosphatidylinositol 4,5-bisphosphate phosphodiesterase eta-1 isoform X2 n=2 Tax=Mobula birostris TaxID=1983395 RepID=UPI003B27DA42